jgi:hypothetical protein
MSNFTDYEAKFHEWDSTAASGIRLGPRPVDSTPAGEGTVFISPTGAGTGASYGDPAAFPPSDGIVSAGDVVFFLEGVYRLEQDAGEVWAMKGGTAAAPITYESYPGEIAIIEIDPAKMPPVFDVNGNNSRVRVANDYTIFRRMVVRGCPYGIEVSGIYNQLHGLYVHSNKGTGINFRSPDQLTTPWTGAYTSYNLVQDCIIEANSDAGGYSTANGGNADGIGFNSGRHNIIRYCEGKGNSDDNFDCWRGISTTIEYCISHVAGIDAGNGNGYKMGGDPPSTGNIARHCLAYSNIARGFDDNGGLNLSLSSCASYANGTRGFQTSAQVKSSYCVATDTVTSNGATETDNSWNRAAGMAYVSTTPYAAGFMVPVTGYDDIGASASEVEVSNLLPDNFPTPNYFTQWAWTADYTADGLPLGPRPVAASATPAPDAANTVWVSPTGTGDGRSEANPCALVGIKTIPLGGDTVFFRGGTYTLAESMYFKTQNSAPIIYESYPGEIAVFDGGGSYSFAMWHEHRDHQIRRLIFENMSDSGLRVEGGYDIIIEGCVFRNNAVNGIQLFNHEGYTAPYLSSHDHTVRDCVFHDNTASGGNSDGLGGSSGERLQVYNCLSYGNSDDNFDCYRTHVASFTRCISMGNGSGGEGNGFKIGGTGGNNGKAFKCISYMAGARGFTWNSSGTLLDQCTSVDSGSYGYSLGNTTTVQNSISSGTATPAVGTGYTEINNSWQSGAEATYISITPGEVGFLVPLPGSDQEGRGAFS